MGDYNGDVHPDLVARNLDGSLWLYAGTGRVDATSKGFAGGVKIGNFGWNVFDTILGVGDFDGDGHPDIVARKADGTLWLYSGTGTGQTGPSRQIGFGWGIYGDIVGVGDANRDGHPDMVGRQPDGSVYFYAGTGTAGGGYLAAPAKIGNFGWEAFNMLVNVHDFNGDGKNDLVARKPDGTLWFYPGTGSGGYGPATRIGDFGWDAFDALVGVGDFNGDGKNDLIARKPDGTLWYYQGTGHVDATSEGYTGTVKIAYFGWSAFDAIVGPGDLNGDGRPDLLARKPDGTLWSYPGSGLPSEGYLGRSPAGNF